MFLVVTCTRLAIACQIIGYFGLVTGKLAVTWTGDGDQRLCELCFVDALLRLLMVVGLFW